MLENVSIVIKTFEHFESLNYLLSSIDKKNIPSPVIIADDSKSPYKDAIEKKYGQLIQEYIVLPFDSGASKGRNVLLSNVHTKYFVLCEDDFIFEERTNLEFLLNLLENTDVELLAGMCYNRVLLLENRDNELIQNMLKLKVRTALHILLWQMYQNETLRNLVPTFRKEVVWDWYGHMKVENGIL